MPIQRQAIQLPQTGVEGPAQLQVQDSFGVSRVAPNPNNDVLNTLTKFGNKVAAGEMQKEVQANYAAGQALRAAGKELTGKEPAPSRKGFKALDAKLRAQQWLADQKEGVDNGDSVLDPGVYTEVLADRFKDLLTGDAETDQILTASMGKYASELGRYQASANYKKRTADGVAQATADVRDHLLAITAAKNKGDQQGEANSRESLDGALSLPTVQNPTLRKQLYADLSVMSLESGDPAVLNYVREQGIEFTPEQERRLASATAGFNTKQNRELSLKYQRDTADFEANVAGAKSIEEFRELARVYQEAWPERVTDKYIIAQEASFRRNLAIGAKNKLMKQDYVDGDLAKRGGKPKEVQATIDAVKADVLNDPTLEPEDKDRILKGYWEKNGIIDSTLKQELTAGMSAPLLDGKLHPNFQAAYENLLGYHELQPDLALRHIPEQQRQLFLDARAATLYGGQALGDAVTTLEKHRVDRKALTRDEREDFLDDLSDATDEALGKGFFNNAHGFTTSLSNEAEIKTRLSDLANLYLNQGMQDPGAAVEAARARIMDTHEQVGNSLVYNAGMPIAERMGIPSERIQDAMDYLYSDLEATIDGFNRDDSILLGNPQDNSIIIGRLDEGILVEAIPARLSSVGANFNAAVIKPEQEAFEREESAAAQHSEDQRAMIAEAQELLGWTKEDAEAAVGNIIGRTVTGFRINSAKRSKADQELAQKYGIESEEELADLKYMRAAFSPGNTLTEEQHRDLSDGKIPARGIRNNNPGNIEQGENWEGLDLQGTDSRFATFKTPEHGVRAMARTLTTYQNKHGLDTVSGIINRWAPGSENNTESYIRSVAGKLGVDPDETLDVQAVMPELIKAIIRHENGDQPYSEQTILDGINMAN